MHATPRSTHPLRIPVPAPITTCSAPPPFAHLTSRTSPTGQASEAVRHSVLGVYEMQDSRFPLSDTQLAALEAVGRARYRGTINADLANRLGVAYRNFHYIVKVGRRHP